MVVAFVFMTISSLSFRMRWKPANRNVTKFLHAMEWSIAGICMIVGLIAVFMSHNDPTSGFIANLYSLHSWIGIIVVIFYSLQFLVGAFSFGCNIPKLNPLLKVRIMLIHRFVGSFIYFAAAITILLGIQEKEGFVNCSYAVTEPDLFPLSNFSKIPTSCKLSHSLGIITLFTALCTTFAMHEFNGASNTSRLE